MGKFAGIKTGQKKTGSNIGGMAKTMGPAPKATRSTSSKAQDRTSGSTGGGAVSTSIGSTRVSGGGSTTTNINRFMSGAKSRSDRIRRGYVEPGATSSTATTGMGTVKASMMKTANGGGKKRADMKVADSRSPKNYENPIKSNSASVKSLNIAAKMGKSMRDVVNRMKKG